MHSAGSGLTNPYFIAVISPTALLLLGVLGKAIIKGGFRATAFYLGFDASLAALYAGLIYLYDVARDPILRNETKLELTTGFIIVSLILFFAIVICHQIWEKEDKASKPVMQFIVLGLFANLVGFGLLMAFVLLVKGV
jgi:hypothetical protein